MSDKRVRPKSRRTKTDCPHHDPGRPQRRDDWDDRHAPGHLGGQFDDAGYSSGHGMFGFQITTLP